MGNDLENQMVSKKDVLILLDRVSVSYSLLKNFNDCGALATLKQLIEVLSSEGDEGKESDFTVII